LRRPTLASFPARGCVGPLLSIGIANSTEKAKQQSRPQREKQHGKSNDETAREPPDEMQRGYARYYDRDDTEGKHECSGNQGRDENIAPA
jgi:hypothetical protein